MLITDAIFVTDNQQLFSADTLRIDSKRTALDALVDQADAAHRALSSYERRMNECSCPAGVEAGQGCDFDLFS